MNANAAQRAKTRACTEHAEQQGQHVEHHEGAAQAVDVIEEQVSQAIATSTCAWSG